MRIALLADIHGNNIALEAVLNDLIAQEPVDHLIILGDLFVFGPEPNEVFDTLKSLPQARYILGNTDRYLLERKYPTQPGSESWQDSLLASFQWTTECINPAAVEFLTRVPLRQVVDVAQWRLVAVHGSPRSDEEGLTPNTTCPELAQMEVPPDTSMLVAGHTHIPMDRNMCGMRVINCGSIGLPFDGIPRAAYAIVTKQPNQEPIVDLRRIDYDIEQAVQQLETRHHPAAKVGAYNLRFARPMATDLIYTPKMRQPSRPGPISESRAC
ncbi:MAG: metallophosphoesterase family protein [Anaerolineae bacterium]